MTLVRAARWISGLVLTVLLIVAGLTFARLDLGQADQFASVGSFVLALLTGGLSVVVALRGRFSPRGVAGPTAVTPDDRATPPGDGSRAGDIRVAYGNENVQQGDHSVMDITRHISYGSSDDRPKRRRR